MAMKGAMKLALTRRDVSFPGGLPVALGRRAAVSVSAVMAGSLEASPLWSPGRRHRCVLLEISHKDARRARLSPFGLKCCLQEASWEGVGHGDLQDDCLVLAEPQFLGLQVVLMQPLR